MKYTIYISFCLNGVSLFTDEDKHGFCCCCYWSCVTILFTSFAQFYLGKLDIDDMKVFVHISCKFCFWLAVCFLILFRTLSHIQFFLFFLFSQIYQFYFWFDGHLNSLQLTVQYNVGNWLHIFNHLKKCLCIYNNIYKYINFLVVSLFNQRYRLDFITCFYCTILDDAMVVMTWCYLFIWWIIVIGFVMLNHVTF